MIFPPNDASKDFSYCSKTPDRHFGPASRTSILGPYGHNLLYLYKGETAEQRHLRQDQTRADKSFQHGLSIYALVIYKLLFMTKSAELAYDTFLAERYSGRAGVLYLTVVDTLWWFDLYKRPSSGISHLAHPVGVAACPLRKQEQPSLLFIL